MSKNWDILYQPLKDKCIANTRHALSLANSTVSKTHDNAEKIKGSANQKVFSCNSNTAIITSNTATITNATAYLSAIRPSKMHNLPCCL
jgi:hypothetical protein